MKADNTDVLRRIHKVYDILYSHNYRESLRIWDEWDIQFGDCVYVCAAINTMELMSKNANNHSISLYITQCETKEEVLEACHQIADRSFYPNSLQNFQVFVASKAINDTDEIGVDLTCVVTADLPAVEAVEMMRAAHFVPSVPILVG